jgi:hypothetical protein
MLCPECVAPNGYLDPSCQLCGGTGMITDDLVGGDYVEDDEPECFGEYAPGSSTCDFCNYQEDCK